MSKLLDFYSDTGPERVGFILKDNTLLEVSNHSDTPDRTFDVSIDDILKHEEDILATFHTHPGSTSNLSSDDLMAFKNWPDFYHIILGNDGFSCYSVLTSGAVIKDETPPDLAWCLEAGLPSAD